MTAPDAPLPAPTQQDRDAATLALTVNFPSPGGGSYRMTGLRVGDDSTTETNLTEQVARAIATARRGGFRAGIESAAKLCEARATQNEDEEEYTTGRFTPSDHRAIEARDIAAAIRSLAPAEKEGT